MSINVSAPINSLGYGICSLNIFLALEQAGANPALWFIGGVEAPPEHYEAINRARQRAAHYDKNADSLRIYHQFDLAQHIGKGRHCGMPIFELNYFKSNEHCQMNNQDVLFVNTHWAKKVLLDRGIKDDSSIFVAPLGIDNSIFNYSEDGNNSKTTKFFNCGKWEYRKGHDVLLEAFNLAFEKNDNVSLIMNCNNPCPSAMIKNQEDSKRYNDSWVKSYKNSKLGDKIIINEERLPSQKDVAKLMTSVDCGVFPSRAEGWGLESSEMLAMGKKVILTDYSGHTEYANSKNSLLIKTNRLENAYDGHWFDGVGEWAEIGKDQIDELVSHMRTVHQLKQAGDLKPSKLVAESMKEFSWKNTANQILRHLSNENTFS